jgi:hypothetical protein
MAYPMIQLQEDGTLKNYENDFQGARTAAIASGNFKTFSTDQEAQDYAKGGYKTNAFKDHYKNPPLTVQGHPQLVPEHYFEPGLQHVSPVAEFVGFGLGKVAVNAASKTKMYSDQIVDRVTKIKTPRTVHHGGPSNINPLKTSYDRAIDEGSAGGALQAGTYTFAKNKGLAGGYASRFNKKIEKNGIPQPVRGGSVYDVDISDVRKIYDINNPSKYMQAEIRKEIKRLKSLDRSEGRLVHVEIKGMKELLTGANSGRHLTGAQREFLEKYGYEAMRTKAKYNFADHKQVDEVISIFRPEKLKMAEKKLGKIPGR